VKRDVLHVAWAVTAAWLLAAMPVRAEVLTVAGVYPADSDGAAAVRSISVERFGGEDGPALALRIEDGLRAAELQGQPWFRVIPGGEAEAVMRGTAQAEVYNSNYTAQRERCTQRDDKDKCVERRKVDVDCRRRAVRLNTSLRLIARQGDLLFSDDRPEQAEVSWCDGDSRPKPTEAMVRDLVEQVVRRLRGDVAPVWRSEGIRVLEERKGLSKEDAAKFANALRLTKTDGQAACRQWQDLAAANPSHPATAFNIGLCAEAAGDLDGADRLYRVAAQLSRASNLADGLRRIEARRRAERQIAAHDRRRS
jgi:hypothetical protein